MYKAGNFSTNKSAEITLQHAGQTIKAERDGVCTEYGTMHGRTLSCFVEPSPSDPSGFESTGAYCFSWLAFSLGGGFRAIFKVAHYPNLSQQNSGEPSV